MKRTFIYDKTLKKMVEITPQPKQQLHAIIPDIPSYDSPIDGREINGRKQRAEDLRRSGSREWEGLEQEKKEALRQRNYSQQRQRAEIRKNVELAIMQMPESERRKLIRY